MRLNFFILILILTLSFSELFAQNLFSDQLDLNHASYEEIRQLPVDSTLARKLYEHVTYKGYFTSIYELRQIEGMTQTLFDSLKPLIRIEPFKAQSTTQEKIEQIYYRLERWTTEEGVNDAFVDLWIDRALDPININTARYDQLINLQNVSPLDAVSILNYRDEVRWIRDERDLRSAPGLSNYAFRSARPFLDYQQRDLAGLHGNLLMRLDNTPFMAEEGEQAEQAGLVAVADGSGSQLNYLPSMYYKARFSYQQKFKLGFSWTRNINEPNHYLNNGSVRIPEGKFYFGVEGLDWNGLQVRKFYLGNYSLSFGQGVIMENTDFFSPRKSGYGFRQRFNGLSGDNSRTRQFTLRGLAVEVGFKNLSAIGFVSYDSRDAILNLKAATDTSNKKTSFNQLIVLDQRFDYALDDVRRADSISWLNSVNELTFGEHIQYDFFPGTFIGITYYESAYDRLIDPNPYQVVGKDYAGNENWNLRRSPADAEIVQTYGGAISRGKNPLWSDALSFRRAYGFDFQTVIKNIVLQGEYGELDKGGKFWKMADDPKAFVLSAYVQYPTFNLLALYRQYDLDFDNPYQRSFSNYRRYKGTIFEDYYYLQSALYGQLYASNPQPQAEKGLYLNLYYQMIRTLTTRIEFDNWLRQADAAKHYRLVGTLDYRPIFPLSIQLRQKWQAREELNDLTANQYYKNLEFRGRLRLSLSNYDGVDLMYANSKLIVRPRPRVFGDIVLDGEAFTAGYTHNFNTQLKMSGSVIYYKGFFWNFEDTQFAVMDSRRGALRWWLALYARLNSNLGVRFKYTADNHYPVSNIDFQAWDTTIQENPGKRFTADWNRKYSHIYFVETTWNF